MTWSSIREFLQIPKELTGKSVGIAIVDSSFPNHPDIATNTHRNTYIVNFETDPYPALMTSDNGPWNRGLHGLWTAAAAAGSGQLSQGHYTGAAPDADLYLLQTGPLNSIEEIESKFITVLSWLSVNWCKHNIRGVVLTVVSSRDTGLLPWQADPIRILCEQLANDGLLVVAASGNTKEITCGGPASSPSILSVGGVIVPEEADIHHAESYHGCRGMTFEDKWIPGILAPAENVVLPMPFQSHEERQNHFTAPYDNLPESYARTEGTSCAGPIILGCAACIWQAHPHWTANQVKYAIQSSSVLSNKWDDLDAGLVNVTAAINVKHADDAINTPYFNWRSWRNKDKSERLEAMRGQDQEDIVSAILSFCREKIPREIMVQMKALLVHQSDKIRTAAITVLAIHSDKILSSDLQGLLHDDSNYVRMAALFALNHCPEMWKEFAFEVIRLFTDDDLDIRYCAIELAAKIKQQCFIEPLISGLYDDAFNERVSTFGARCSALEAITGITFEPMPEWREGQCWYSDRSTQARLHIAQEWESRFKGLLR